MTACGENDLKQSVFEAILFIGVELSEGLRLS